MPRSVPLDPPDSADVATTVERNLDLAVVAVTRFDRGLNAVYRVETQDRPVVCKVATYVTDAELRTEAALHERIDAETSVPVPSVLGVADAVPGTPDAAALLVTFRDGRTVPGTLELSPTDRRRLVAESGHHLAAVHDLSVGGAGRLTVAGGRLVAEDRDWPAVFADLADDVVAGLHGEGYTTGEGAFADLAAPVETALARGPGVERVAPGPLLTDYRPANLVFEPPGHDPVIAAVLDVGAGPAGDGLADLALTENALVDVPLGGTGAAASLRERLRSAYRDRRSVELAGVFRAGGRYDRYRLLAAARRLAQFDYWVQFARETDREAAAGRLRAAVERRVAALSE